MNTSPGKLSVVEKIGYSLGDLAANLIFQTLMAFLAFFYTDIYKIPASAASLVMLTGVISLLALSAPDFGESGKVLYAFLTYFLLVIVYSANNLPYSALSGVLTGDMQERNSLSSYRFFAVMVAQFIIQVFLLPLALSLGHGDQAKGFEQVMFIFAAVGVACFIIT